MTKRKLSQTTDVELGRKICCELFVEVRDKDGKLIATRYKKGDLILNNFKKLAAQVFGGKADVGAVNEGGVSKTLHTSWSGGRNFNDDGTMDRKLAIGTGTVAPTRDDYALGSKVAETTGVTTTIGPDYWTYAASITLTTAYDITEAGWFCYYLDSVGSTFWFMLFRDTFAAVSVPAGGTISVTFKVTV